MDSDAVVWKTDEENQWALYSNSNAKLPQNPKTSTNTQKSHSTKGLNQADNPFYFNKIRTEAKGFIAHTPKGYGIIQSYLPDSETTTVKVEGNVYEFEKREIMSEIPVEVIFLRETTKVIETIMMPIMSTISDLFTRIESSGEGNEEEVKNVKLYYQGKELDKTPDSLEKMKVVPYAKFLAIPSIGKPLYMNRFPTINEGWYYDANSLDGICITPSRKIQLKGFSVFRGAKGTILNPQIEILQGDNTKSSVLYSKTFTLGKDSGGPHEKIYQIMLNKTLTFEAGSSFSITFKCQTGQSFYGNGGKQSVVGEGDVSFTFKECSGAHNGTSASSGQVPELFYYV